MSQHLRFLVFKHVSLNQNVEYLKRFKEVPLKHVILIQKVKHEQFFDI